MGGERMTTISLELAKELQQICKEKGITMPESFHAWRMDSNVYMSGKREYFLYQNFAYHHPELTPPEPEKVDGIKIIRAYTLDELLEILPKKITVNKFLYCPVLQVYPALYIVVYQTIETHNAVKKGESPFYPKEAIGQDSNPANAACKLLIYLLKEGLI
jgi:hypothetical protein